MDKEGGCSQGPGWRSSMDRLHPSTSASPAPVLPAWISRLKSMVTPSDSGSGAAQSPAASCWFTSPPVRQLSSARGASVPTGSADVDARHINAAPSRDATEWSQARNNSRSSECGGEGPGIDSDCDSDCDSDREEDDDGGGDDDDVGDDDVGDEYFGAEDEHQLRRPGRPQAGNAGKLWGPTQFPEGLKGHACWDWANIQAAQAWTCPCSDRRNCIGSERLKPEELLIHRKECQTTRVVNRRDAARLQMADHYSSDTRTMSRSFVVGGLNDCCAASRGLADGHSWKTWSRARADLRAERSLHAGRRNARESRESDQRRVINAYIRDLRLGMDGSKGGSRGSGKTFTGKAAKKQRWEAYKNARVKARLPVVGSERLFYNCWNAQENLVELEAKGHALCDECAKCRVLHDQIDDRTDDAGRQMQRDLEVREELHAAEHRGERWYGDDMWHCAEHNPHKMTMLNMDAPTQVGPCIDAHARPLAQYAHEYVCMCVWVWASAVWVRLVCLECRLCVLECTGSAGNPGAAEEVPGCRVVAGECRRVVLKDDGGDDGWLRHAVLHRT